MTVHHDLLRREFMIYYSTPFSSTPAMLPVSFVTMEVVETFGKMGITTPTFWGYSMNWGGKACESTKCIHLIGSSTHMNSPCGSFILMWCHAVAPLLERVSLGTLIMIFWMESRTDPPHHMFYGLMISVSKRYNLTTWEGRRQSCLTCNCRQNAWLP